MNARIRSRIGPKYWSSSSWPLGDGAPKSVRPVSSRSGRCSASRRSIRKYSCSGPMLVKTRVACRVVEPAQHPECLGAERFLRAQERDLEVERLAGVRHVGGRDRHRDAVGLDLEEDRARDIPAGVATRLEGRAQAARRERARIRLALDQVPARELGDGLAVAGRRQERVVLLGRRAGHRHEPVRVVGRPLGERPLLHAVGYRVDDRRIEGFVALDRPAELLEDRLGEVLALGDLVEHVLAVDVCAGVLEEVLGLRDPVRGDLRDGGLSCGHRSPAGCSHGAGRTPRRACAKVAMSLPADKVAVQHRRGLPRLCIFRRLPDVRALPNGRFSRGDGRPRAGRAGARTHARRRRSGPSARRSRGVHRARAGSRRGGADGRT